jgi:hypothetical protein
MHHPTVTRDERTGSAETHHDDTHLAEIGVWLSGLCTFLHTGHQFVERNSTAPARDLYRVTTSALERCEMLASDGALKGEAADRREFNSIRSLCTDSLAVADALANADQIGPTWNAYRSFLHSSLMGSPDAARLMCHAESYASTHLAFQQAAVSVHSAAEEAELSLLVPKIAKPMFWLGVLQKMIEREEPLRVGIVPLSEVRIQLKELFGYIENRLQSIQNRESSLSIQLDGAAYTLSIETRKVFSQELNGVLSIEDAAEMHSRMESATSILVQGLEHILTGLARINNPEADHFQLFPRAKLRLAASTLLQQELSFIADRLVGLRDSAPEDEVAKFASEIRSFLEGSGRDLYFKDFDTLVGFMDELSRPAAPQDLQFSLHRLDAFLETLRRQVSLRSVLSSSDMPA